MINFNFNCEVVNTYNEKFIHKMWPKRPYTVYWFMCWYTEGRWWRYGWCLSTEGGDGDEGGDSVGTPRWQWGIQNSTVLRYLKKKVGLQWPLVVTFRNAGQIWLTIHWFGLQYAVLLWAGKLCVSQSESSWAGNITRKVTIAEMFKHPPDQWRMPSYTTPVLLLLTGWYFSQIGTLWLLPHKL